jgi:nanoRNase/pAp phosphatase (c-di-AMP/oligoRNAs hydrolase)
MTEHRTTRSERFLKAMAEYRHIVVVSHDNPDPDAIATGWAIRYLIEQKQGRSPRVVAGGAIIRAENREMVKLLGPPIELVRDVPVDKHTGIVLVDCGTGGQNHLFAEKSIAPAAVIDHHLSDGRKTARRTWFEDIRPQAAASASIAAGYLREQGLEPCHKLATALIYAIRTETRGAEVAYSRLDRSIFLWLTRFSDPAFLAEIENAQLSPEYFSDLTLALQSTFIYGDTALCLLPRASGAEIVGEVADLLIRCEGIRRVLCGAIVQDDVVLSVRTERNGEDASELVRTTLQGLGHGGGHRHRAGGKIPGRGRGPAVAEVLQDELLTRWLITCGIDRQRGKHLIARDLIVENL